MRVTILGCGASVGVPVIGCDCATCQSGDPKNKRLRVSILVEFDDGFRLLVDTSPDLRQQALLNSINTVDAIIYTHSHADHTHGIDDVRSFNANRNGAIDAYGTAEDISELQAKFPYIFSPHDSNKYWLRAALSPRVITPGDVLRLSEQAAVQTFRQLHGRGESLGLRFGDVVYSTDVHAFPDESLPYLRSTKLWIVDCLREGPAGSHANLETALGWCESFKPERAVLTHMNHELEYHALKAKLPAHIEPGYDGFTFSC